MGYELCRCPVASLTACSLSTLAKFVWAWFKFALRIYFPSLLSGPASFPCAVLMRPQTPKQYCPQIEYYAPLPCAWLSTLLGYELCRCLGASLTACSLSTLAKFVRAWFKFALRKFIFSSLLSGPASFLCAVLMRPQRPKQYCPQIVYVHVRIFVCRSCRSFSSTMSA